jgi:8-oxo-dGTP pyrophosphatase MutT (NUDIX family)
LFNRKSRLLVLKYPFVLVFTKKHTGRYSLIGGNIEKQETPPSALIRETKEEAGIKMSVDDFTFVKTTKTIKGDVTHERYYFLLNHTNWKFKLKEVEKFDTIEWVDFFDNKSKFKKSDRKVIKEIFIKEY